MSIRAALTSIRQAKDAVLVFRYSGDMIVQTRAQYRKCHRLLEKAEKELAEKKTKTRRKP